MTHICRQDLLTWGRLLKLSINWGKQLPKSHSGGRDSSKPAAPPAQVGRINSGCCTEQRQQVGSLAREPLVLPHLHFHSPRVWGWTQLSPRPGSQQGGLQDLPSPLVQSILFKLIIVQRQLLTWNNLMDPLSFYCSDIPYLPVCDPARSIATPMYQVFSTYLHLKQQQKRERSPQQQTLCGPLMGHRWTSESHKPTASVWILGDGREASIQVSSTDSLQTWPCDLGLWDCSEMEGGSSGDKEKPGFDRHTASTQRCVLTSDSYLTKCPKEHRLHTLLFKTSSKVFCGTLSASLKLRGSRGSWYMKCLQTHWQRKGLFFLSPLPWAFFLNH